MKRINNKGFTLVELLAVIVILAILVLVALPNVTGVMANARKSAFRTEALTMARDGAGMAYTNAMLGGVAASTGYTADATGKVWKISGGEYLCITVANLISKGFIDKKSGNAYSGYIQLYNNGTTTDMYIKITNGTYYINTTFNTLASATNLDDVVKVGTTAGTCPTPAANSIWATSGTNFIEGK